MNHADVKKHLADYLEGDLDLDARAVVDAHLDHCDDCSREVTEMQQTIRLLRLMPEPETPPMIAANVMRRIRAGESRPGPFGRMLGGLRTIFEPSFVLPASAVTAAALVVMVAQGPGEGGLQGLWNLGVSGNEEMAAEGLGTRVARVLGFDSFEVTKPTIVSNSARTPVSTRFRRQAAGTLVIRSQGSNPALAGRAQSTDPNASRTTGGPNPNPSGVAGYGSGGPRRRFYSDPILAPPIPNALVPDVYAANRAGRSLLAPPASRTPRGPTLVHDRFLGGALGTVAVTQPLTSRGALIISSGGDDPRDGWLARGLEDPANFARFIGEKTLAEQELWVTRLSERALARGLLEELVLALQGSGDETASWLAEDFAAQAGRVRSEDAASSEPTRR